MACADTSSIVDDGRGVVEFSGLDADRTIVWLRGEHDLTTVTAVAEILARAIAVDDADFVVDLSEVECIDAATVRLIVRTREFLRSRSRSLELRAPSRSAQLMLDRCGLAHLVVPRPARERPMAGAVGAVATDQVVTAAETDDRRARRTAAEPRIAAIPVRIDRSPAARQAATVGFTDLVDDRNSVVESRGP